MLLNSEVTAPTCARVGRGWQVKEMEFIDRLQFDSNEYQMAIHVFIRKLCLFLRFRPSKESKQGGL